MKTVSVRSQVQDKLIGDYHLVRLIFELLNQKVDELYVQANICPNWISNRNIYICVKNTLISLHQTSFSTSENILNIYTQFNNQFEYNRKFQ